jgi:hypothetical protein
VGNKFGLVIALAFVLAGCAPPQTEVTPLTPEAKAYVRYLNLSGVQMKSTESYLKQNITEIEGSIQNQGDRALVSVEIMCVFYDAYGQVTLRERVPIVKRSGGPLKPGGTRSFRLPFDDIPPSWNNQMPSLVIASIIFAG